MIETLPLRRVARVINGGTPTSDEANWGGDVPWATPIDLGLHHGGVVLDTARTLTRQGAHSGSSVLPPGSILVSTRAPIGYVARTDAPMAFNQGCRGLIPTSRADARFLAYALVAARHEMDARGQGSTFAELSGDGLASVPIPLPPLDEQRRIADFLDTETARLDRLVSLRERQLAALPIRWRSCLDDAMAALVHRFGAVPLGRSLARIEQGTSPQCDNYPAPDGEWGVLKAGAVKGDRFLPEENKHLPEGLMPEARYEVRAGDLLVTRANTPALVGAAAVVPKDVRPRLILCDKIFRLRLTQNLRPQFVALLSQASVIRDARASAATGTSSSMVNLTNQDVKSWPIPAAPLDVQRILVGELMAVRDSQHRLELALAAQARLLHERSQALITAAVTGQLDVTTARGGRS